MSKNKIPSSEVPGPGPSLWQALPLSLAHGGARPAGCYPGTELCGGHARPRVATAGTAFTEGRQLPLSSPVAPLVAVPAWLLPSST